MQLCPCNPNTGRNAKSSFPAVGLDHSVCAVVEKKRALEERGAGCRKKTSPTTSASQLCLIFEAILRFICIPSDSISHGEDLVKV